MNRKKEISKIRKAKWRTKYYNQVLSIFPPKLSKTLRKATKQKIPDEKMSYYIFGDVNTGKTIHAGLILIKRLKQYVLSGNHLPNIEYHFLVFSEFYQQLKESYARKDFSEGEIIKKYMECDVLIIDDLITKAPSSWVLDTMYLIINYRYLHELQTIITANVDLNEARQLLQDDRIIRRIEDTYTIIYKKMKWNHGQN